MKEVSTAEAKQCAVILFSNNRAWLDLAVLNSLTSPNSRRLYQYALEKFIA